MLISVIFAKCKEEKNIKYSQTAQRLHGVPFCQHFQDGESRGLNDLFSYMF